MRLAPVPAGQIPRLWPVLGTMLDRACQRPGCDETELSLLLVCLRREALLIAVLDDDGRPVAAGVTQVRETPEGRACWILALGGALAGSWQAIIAEVEAGARRVGCRTVEFVGRPGWRRIHPDYTAIPCSAGVYFSKALRH